MQRPWQTNICRGNCTANLAITRRQRAWNFLAQQHPIQGCAEVIDVCQRGDCLAVRLLWCDVTGRSLNALLDGTQCACLTEVDDLDGPILANHHVGWLHVSVDKSTFMHMPQRARGLREILGNVHTGRPWAQIQCGGVNQLHEQRSVEHWAKHVLLILQVFGDGANVRMIKLGAHLVLLNNLLNEPFVLLCAANHMLQRHHLARLGIHHCIDNACRTFADFVDHFVAE